MDFSLYDKYSDEELQLIFEEFQQLPVDKQKKMKSLIYAYEYRYSKKNIKYFIENYVYIEDRDSPELAVLFKLWDGQVDALNMFENNRLNIVLKARQLGLTWLALAFGVRELIFNKGYQIVALSKKEDDAKELIRRVEFILRYMPKWLIVEDCKENSDFKGLKWSSTSLSVKIFHPNGETSIFNAMPASQDSGRSFTANLVIIDEWAFQQFAYTIWSAAYPTINRPSGGKVIGLSTAKRMTLFEEIWDKANKKLNTFKTIFLPWWTDPRRDKEWYEQTKKDLPLSYKAEYPNTPEEAFEAAEGVAFPEFSRLIHVVTPFALPSHWKRWISVDNGYTDPYCWLWHAVSDDGIVYTYREFTRDPNRDPKITYSEQAKKCLELTKEEKISYVVVGHDAWNVHHNTITEHTPSGKSIINYYNDGGIKNCIKAMTDRILGKATIHEYLKPYDDENINRTVAKWQIFENCTTLIQTLPQLLCDENDAEKVADCSIDHCYDSARYGLISHHASRSLLYSPIDIRKMSPDMLEDYRRATKEDKVRLIKKWGLLKK